MSDRVGIKLLGSFIDPESFPEKQEITKLRSALLSGDIGNVVSVFEETQINREQNSTCSKEFLNKSKFLIEQLKDLTRAGFQ